MKKQTINHFITACICMACVLQSAKAQLNLGDDKVPDRLTPKEFTIPVSPLFDLMGAAPAQVARTSDIRDFKVDWSFRNWRLNPNLAIQAQPIWEIFYNRKNLQRYQVASYWKRMLASLDVSLGTVQGTADNRQIGGALKMNLYRQKDPLMETGAYDDIQAQFELELATLKQKDSALLNQLDSLYKPADIQKLRLELHENDVKLATFYSRRNSAIQEKARSYISDNWNTAFVDVAFGKVFSYNTDSAGSLSKLSLNRTTGNGVWLNAGFGVGKRGLVTALIRSTFYEEEISFSMQNKLTGETTTASAIAANNLFTLGINYRYGGPIYNFFAEFIWEGKKTKTALGALQSVFDAPENETIVANSVKWETVNPYVINLGGDWRIGRNVILNYGLRCVLNNQFKAISFTPIASISCLMR
jgi:hypothetical protein